MLESLVTSKTRIKTLCEDTISANSRFFDNIQDVPRQALTVGIQTVMNANEVIMMATGPTLMPTTPSPPSLTVTPVLPTFPTLPPPPRTGWRRSRRWGRRPGAVRCFFACHWP